MQVAPKHYLSRCYSYVHDILETLSLTDKINPCSGYSIVDVNIEFDLNFRHS